MNPDEDVMLTTLDNPYDPFTQYDEWDTFDTAHGYYTAAYLARQLITSDEISETDQLVALNNAIDDILSENVTGNYKKVTRKFADA